MIYAILILASAIGHLVFSKYGFNPADDGFILSVGRRISHGQIPHRDFISIRTTLSHIIHLPELLIGRQYCLIMSRFIFWIETAVIAGIWIEYIHPPFPVFIGLIVLCLNINIFPPMAWHTVDAIFFMSLSLIIDNQVLAFLLAGLAPLCRQNFIFALLVLGLLKPDPLLLISLIPTAVYFAFIGIKGGFFPMMHQLSSHHLRKFLNMGVAAYVNLFSLAGLAFASFVYFSNCYELIYFFPVIALIYIGITGKSGHPAFFIFSYSLTIALLGGDLKILTAVGIAWSASLSIGYPYPALLMGTLFLTTVPPHCQGGATVPLLVGLFSVALFYRLRLNRLYRQPAAKMLKWRLSDVMAGGSGIFTDESTYFLLSDLHKAKEIACRGGHSYCLMPDMPCEWILSSQSNPLPSDWPQETELPTEKLKQSVLEIIRDHRSLRIIIQKYEIKRIAFERISLSDRYQVVNAVKSDFALIEETDYFQIYGCNKQAGDLNEKR